jgi:hypothetical protein
VESGFSIQTTWTEDSGDGCIGSLQHNLLFMRLLSAGLDMFPVSILVRRELRDLLLPQDRGLQALQGHSEIVQPPQIVSAWY